MTEALRQHFRPEFLNRIDEIIFFHALGLEHMKQIVDIQIRGLLKRLEERKIHVELTDAAKGFLVPEGYDPMYGARPLKRTIQRRVLDPLAMRVLRGRVPRRRPRRRRRGRQWTDVREDSQAVQASSKRLANPRTPPGMNPRDKRPGERRTLGAAGRPGGAVWYVLGFLLLMALAQTWFLAPAGQQISYSEFKQAVRGGQVAEVDRRRADDPRHATRRERQRQPQLQHRPASRIPSCSRSSMPPASSTPASSSAAGCRKSSAGSSRSCCSFAHLELLLPAHGRRRGRRDVVRPQQAPRVRRRRREGRASPTWPASTRPSRS